MLQTPLGILEIQIDNVPIDYAHFPIPLTRTCADLKGRYAIIIPFSPDQSEHTISCRIKNYESSEHDSPESGECQEAYGFYQNGTKLSLGMEGDTGVLNGKRLATYDYDTDYLDDGVQYCILPFTKTTKFVFGVAWINGVTDENDIQTWFGADPTLLEFKSVVDNFQSLTKDC